MTNSIKLLNGKIENKQEVIDNMYSDDYYYGYLGKNALSSSSIKLLLDSAKTYLYINKYGQKETQPLRDGHLFHTMILEPEKINDIVFVDVQSKNTNKFKEAKNIKGNLTFQSFESRFNEIKDLEIVDVETNEILKVADINR